MANTKRFTINQHWQQISTGNVTLTGCNTVATYHIYVGTDTPTGDSDYISDTLAEPTPYNFDTPVWVKLNVTNQLDEADMIAIGELAEQVDTGSEAPITDTPTIIFNQVTNCKYENGSLIYTGTASDPWEANYQAFAENITKFEFTVTDSTRLTFALGESNDINTYDNGENGIQVNLSSIGYVASQAGNMFDLRDEAHAFLAGDVVRVTVADQKLNIENIRNGVVWTSLTSPYLTTPKYLVVLSNNGFPLNIKAI